MKFTRKKLIFAGMLSTIILLGITSFTFSENPGIPAGYEDIEAAIYSSQEALIQQSSVSCSNCHSGIAESHHLWIISGDPNDMHNPNCPNPPAGGECFPCHWNYNEQCIPAIVYQLPIITRGLNWNFHSNVLIN